MTVRRSLGFAFIERYLVICLQLVSFTMLARLLTPKQIGLYSVSMALISMAQVVRDFGLSNYLIQRPKLEPADIATAIGMSMLLGGGLFVTINAAAPWIGAFYDDASLTPIVRIISLNFLILPLNSILIALLRRDMQFNVQMRINVSAAVVSTLTTLGLAWGGFGSWSLACGEIASNLTVASGVLLAGGGKRLLPPRLTRWREVLHFGGALTFSNVITSVTMDINDLVVGKVLNFGQVAISSRAQGLMNLFHRDIMGPIRAVAYPAFAQLNREGHAMEQKFIYSLAAVTAVAWPFYGFMAMFPLEVLRLMFGPQWDQSAALVPWFCLAGAFSATISLIPTLMLAAGHSKTVAVADLIIQPAKALLLTAVIVYFRDLRAFVIAFFIVAAVSVPYFYAFKQRVIKSDFKALLAALARNLLLAALTLAPAAIVVLAVRRHGQGLGYGWFFACVGLTIAAWVLALALLRHMLAQEFMRQWRSRFPVRPSQA